VNPAVSFAPERLRAILERGLQEVGAHPAGYCIALSGGLDSTTLAAALANSGAPHGLALRAIHVDHRLHPDSAQWSAHCRQLAERLGVPCEIVAVDARPARARVRGRGAGRSLRCACGAVAAARGAAHRAPR